MKCMHCAVPIRNAKDIAGIRAACKLARQILDKAHAAVKPGVTTDEIDQVVKYCFLHHFQTGNIVHRTCYTTYIQASADSAEHHPIH